LRVREVRASRPRTIQRRGIVPLSRSGIRDSRFPVRDRPELVTGNCRCTVGSRRVFFDRDGHPAHDFSRLPHRPLDGAAVVRPGWRAGRRQSEERRLLRARSIGTRIWTLLQKP
jgi:hypothetical protein